MDLQSNPQASIRWQKEDGSIIKQDNQITGIATDYGPDFVRLNISNVSEIDDGIWYCNISKGGDSQVDEDMNGKTMDNSSTTSTTISVEMHLVVLSK